MRDPHNGALRFRVVLRGYDPSEVDKVLAQMQQVLWRAEAESERWRSRTAELEAHVKAVTGDLTRVRTELDRVRAQGESAATSSTFVGLGQHIGHMLALAESEAEEIRAAVAEEVAAERAAAQSDATQLVEEARRSAEEILDDANRKAAARREEAEALFRHQEAVAASALADFKEALAERLESAETQFSERFSAAERSLREAHQRATQLHAEAERVEDAAAKEAERTVAEARQQADAMLAAARAKARGLRGEADRELFTCTSRHDSVNGQLTTVRHMLAALEAAQDIDDVAAVADPNQQPHEKEDVELRAAEERQQDGSVNSQSRPGAERSG